MFPPSLPLSTTRIIHRATWACTSPQGSVAPAVLQSTPSLALCSVRAGGTQQPYVEYRGALSLPFSTADNQTLLQLSHICAGYLAPSPLHTLVGESLLGQVNVTLA